MSTVELPPHVAAPPAPARAAPTAEAPRRSVTVEQLIYAGLFLLSALTHLWGLDNRALHHDETLHAAYSYYVLTGRGFVHDPLLHGPFLYFWGALIYFLFGDSNYTARLGAALFGSVLTVLPYFLRRELGRGAALAASVAMLLSPVFLYVGRFVRHDIYAVTFELIVFISLVRYASTRRASWLFVGAAALALMFTTLETFFLYLAIFLPVVVGIFFYRVWRPGAAVVAGLGVLIALLLFVLPGHAARPFQGSDTVNRASGPYVCPDAANPFPPANPIQVDRPGPLLGLPPLATADNSYALCVRNQADNDLGVYLIKVGQFFGHPAVLASVALTLLALGALYWLIWRRADADGLTPWSRAAERGDATLAAFASLGAGRRWLIALAIFFSIYALLFSAFFTNPVGIISGTTGSLLYWLAQHDVQRGGQPRHFYLVLLWIYEPLALIWATVGVGMVLRMGWRRLRAPAPAPDDAGDGEERAAPAIDWSLAMPALLAWWLVGTLFLYSWAGEKMPWLTLHLALPLTLLASWAFARTMAWWRRPNPDTAGAPTSERTALAIFMGVFGAIAVLCFLLITISLRAGGQQLAFIPWITPIGLVMVTLLAVGGSFMMGRRWAVGALALSATVLGLLYGARSSFQLSFRWGDVPREMLIYTQTSPDVARVIDRLEQASRRRGGLLDMPIWYDNETVWDWYMRRFTGAKEQPAGVIPTPPDDLMAMLIMEENLNDQNRRSLDGFRVQRFPLRWWFPEEAVYRLPEDWPSAEVTERSPLLMRMLRTPFDGKTAAQYWDYMLFRNLPAPLGSTDFNLVVRPELANEIGLGTGELK